jgi:hypothetical protein
VNARDQKNLQKKGTKVTSPMTTTIRIPPYSKCGTILQTFLGDRTEGLKKNDCGIIIFWTKYELVMNF